MIVAHRFIGGIRRITGEKSVKRTAESEDETRIVFDAVFLQKLQPDNPGLIEK